MTVVILIGILSALAYVSLADLISTNKAKETAQTIRTFAERALAEGKRQSKTVTIDIPPASKNIRYTVTGAAAITETLGIGYSASSSAPTCVALGTSPAPFVNTVTSEIRIGLSGISGEGFFAACDGRSYCGAAVKTKANNSFIACIKRRNSTTWEVL